MTSVKLDFENRKREIESYLQLTEVLTSDSAIINYTEGFTQHNISVSNELQKILIANGFLLLYNLIEATVRNSIAEIFDQIEIEEITFAELNDNLQKIWIDHNTIQLKERSYQAVTLRECILNIAQGIIAKEKITLAKDLMNFSGNLDARKIRGLAAQYGFAIPTKSGDNLDTIKRKRNHLAHGDFTFADIGKDFSERDLQNFKQETFDYLDDVIANIEVYISNKGFKKAAVIA